MPDSTNPERQSEVRVLTPDEEAARTMARAMASQTAGDILRLFQGGEMTASDIGTALQIPIPTVMYHLEALLQAGLIEVSRVRYSVKGREVKVYRQSDQVFIVAPRHADIRETLVRYASLFGLTLLAAGMVSILSFFQLSGSIAQEMKAGGMDQKGTFAAAPYSPAEIAGDYARELNAASLPMPAPVPADMGYQIPELAIGILIGGCLVIGMLICLDVVRKKRAGR